MVRGKELSPQQRSQICELHSLGYGYRRIFKLLAEVPLSTIKYTCQQEAKRKENQSRPRSGAPRKLPARRRKDSSPVPVDDVMMAQSFTELDAAYQDVTYHDLLAMVDWSIFPTEQLHPIEGISLMGDAAIDAAVTRMDDSIAQMGNTAAPRIHDLTTHMHHDMPPMGDPAALIDDTMAPHTCIHDVPPHTNGIIPHVNDNDILRINDIIPQIENTHIDDTINNMTVDADLSLAFQDPTYQGVSYHDLLALVDWSIVW
ncbi:hypothetical protein ACQKWADRAFT_296704 [Trichoderma austrokoningii]